MSEQTPAQNPAQGWYTDPHDAARLRWWDGSTWTDHVHPPAGEPAASAPVAEASSAAAEQSAAQPAAATPGASRPAATPQAQAQPAATQAQADLAAASAAASQATQPTQSGSASSPGAGGIITNPAPQASETKAQRGAVAEWFSIRSNQILFAVLVIAIILFVVVMVGGAS